MEIILGVAASLLVQFLKTKFGTSSWETIAIVLGVSLVAAALYTSLVDSGMWETVAHVFVVAGAFYSFVIQRFE